MSEKLDKIRCDAAKLLESRPNAWGQGKFRQKNDDGTWAYCALGALREAAGYYTAYDAYAASADAYDAYDAYAASADAYADAAEAAAAEAAATNIVTFNDAPGRTAAEVVALLRGNLKCD